MATRIKPAGVHLYEQDFYAWAKAQADLLRAGRFADLDLEHLIEEVDDLGESLRRSVRSRIRTIIEHLLKLQHPPAQAPRGGWYDTILAQRSDLLDELTPSIRREVEPTLPDLYDRARQNAVISLRKHGEHGTADALPTSCPYLGPDHPRVAAVTARPESFPQQQAGAVVKTQPLSAGSPCSTARCYTRQSPRQTPSSSSIGF